MWFSTSGNHFFLRYFLFRIIGRPTYSSPTKSSWWKWSDVSRTSAESTLKKTRWQGKYAAGYKKVQTGLDRSPTPAVLWRDALHTRNQMFQKSSHFCFAMISTDMRSQKQRNLPILLTSSTRPGTGNFLFAHRFEENERESTMLAEIHRSHWNNFWPGSSNVKLHTDQIRIRFLETPCYFITGPIRPFSRFELEWKKNTTSNQSHCQKLFRHTTKTLSCKDIDEWTFSFEDICQIFDVVKSLDNSVDVWCYSLYNGLHVLAIPHEKCDSIFPNFQIVRRSPYRANEQ